MTMNLSKCPHCGVSLGNFRYADTCPHCHEELKQNTRPLAPGPKPDPQKVKPWWFRMFMKVLRYGEN